MYKHFINNSYDKILRVDPDVFDKVVFISDIHGEREKFCELKRVLNNFERCLLVCLGDITDRGPNSYALLKEFMHPEGYASFMLLGNHEYMLGDWIRNDRPRNKPYFYNTGQQLRNTPENELEEIASWIESLPLSMNLEIASQVYEVAHGTIVDDYENYDPEDLLWCSRLRRLLFSGESILRLRNTCAVVGHNPTRLVREWLDIKSKKGTENDILSVGNRLFFIDCGCGKPDRFGNNMLGALIVDTKTGELSEIYIK